MRKGYGSAGMCSIISRVLDIITSKAVILGSLVQHPGKRTLHQHRGWHHYPGGKRQNLQLLNTAVAKLKARTRHQAHRRNWRKNTRLVSSLTKRNEFNCSTLSSFSSSSSVLPPATKKPIMRTVLGYKWIDEYAWMQQDFSEEFIEYIKAENNFTGEYFSHLKTEQEKLGADIYGYEEGDDETDLNVIGDFAYYPSISKRGSSVFCRRNIRTGEDQILLDSNDVMELFGYNQVVITSFKISPCQRYLGAVVEQSPDIYDGLIINMDGQLRQRKSCYVECIHDISNMEFLSEESILYTKPFNLQAKEVWRHQIGTSQEQDELVFEEMDERFFIDLSHTKDRRYIAINCNSHTTSELWLIDCHQSTLETQLMLVWPRQDSVECYLDHCGNTLFALSNSGDSSELELFKAQMTNHQHHSSETISWEKLYSPPSGHVIQDLDVFSSHCVLALLVNNVPQLAILQHAGDKKPLHIELPQDYTSLLPSLNANINATHYHFQLSSPVHPPRSFELHLETSDIKMQEDYKDTISEGDRSNVHSFMSKSRRKRSLDYTCKRLMAQSQDGTKVPVTIFHGDNLILDGSHPMLVIGYGAYGRNVEMDYKPERMALLSRGWVLAFCHVRGGGELGKGWYYSGKGDQKHHSFEDFESCIEFLHSSGFSQPALTAGWGASAGAVLLGVLCNRRPELLKAAVMRMPFVDVLSSMLDSNSPLTSQDVEEWGDPWGSATELDYISSYCPYHNLRPQTYPSILITSSMDDQRVPAWVPAKYTARLRDRTRNHHDEHCVPNTVLLKMHNEGGHFGPDEDSGWADQEMMEWSFLYKELSIEC